MSASLVGSEMCIRDSTTGVVKLSCEAGRQTTRSATGLRRNRAAAGARACLLYTSDAADDM
eukprot:10277386-Alexandrium_andersonii.AAC.1